MYCCIYMTMEMEEPLPPSGCIPPRTAAPNSACKGCSLQFGQLSGSPVRIAVDRLQPKLKQQYKQLLSTPPTGCTFVPQVAPLLEKPVGMALYEYRNGQIGPLSIQSGMQGRSLKRHMLQAGSTELPLSRRQ